MKKIALTLTLLWLAALLGFDGFRTAHTSSNLHQSDDPLWRFIDETQLANRSNAAAPMPLAYRVARFNRDALARALAATPAEFGEAARTTSTVITLPLPDGSFGRFRIVESPILAPGLAAEFPDINTYAGQGIDDPTATVRFDRTPAGFHAMILSAGETVYLNPYPNGDGEVVMSFLKRDANRGGDRSGCLVDDTDATAAHVGRAIQATPSVPNGSTLRTYRLALAATGEYTTFHGGTVDSALAAMTTTMNRVNGIYEREFAVRMVLVEQERSIIYTNGTTDPYANNSGSQMLSQNQSNLDTVVGANNYDIGHVFSTGGGGVAALGVVCASGAKGRGVTGLSRPVGDVFDVDFVAHEMGHQFGGNHTFNGSQGNCSGGNRSSSTAYEPGSGSTIMAYAGICRDDNLQVNSDDYFHTASFDEITARLRGTASGCAGLTQTGNTPPTVEAGPSFTIPARTPFTLTAQASDADGDTLTYCWEQYDLGVVSPPNTDNGNRPLFRSFNPTTDPSRTFPRLSDVLKNTTTVGETYPTTARAMTFRVTVRDNRSGGGGVDYDQTQVTVAATDKPFAVLEPNQSTTWAGGSQQTITWDVVGTNGAPINCAEVRISLSTDGGQTFSTVLADKTPNDGSETVTAPNAATTAGRIRVEAVGNIFFDISDTDLTITTSTNSAPTVRAGTPISIKRGDSEGRFTLATVADGETPAGDLRVEIVGKPADVALTNLTNIAGTVSAVVVVTCSSEIGAKSVVLQATDAGGLKTTATLTVNVGTNPAPTLGTYSATEVAVGESVVAKPTLPPGDNGSFSVKVSSSNPALGGEFAVNATTGDVTASRLSATGTTDVQVTVTDACGDAVTRTFSLTVVPVVRITDVTFQKKILTITGLGFGSAPTVLLNGNTLSASVIQTTSDSRITAKGNKKKLGLRNAQNTVQIVGPDGRRSNVFALNLFSNR